jgi:hypothetical protein
MPVLILLLLGIVGFAEMVLSALLLKPGGYALVMPGSVLAKISMAFVALGLLGFLGFVFELIEGKCRFAFYKATFVVSYFGLLLWVSQLYAGV